MVSSEILAVLADEVAAAGEEMHASLSRLASGDAAAFQEAREDYLLQVQRIASAAELLELEGLQRICAVVADNLAAVATDGIREDLRGLLEHWPQLLLGYLKTPKDGVYARE